MGDFVETICQIVAFPVFVGLLVVMVSPRLLRLNSRWWALSMLGVVFVAAGISMVANPKPKPGEPLAGVIVGGLIGIAVGAWLISSGRHRATAAAGPSIGTSFAPPVKDRSPEEVDATTRERRRATKIPPSPQRVLKPDPLADDVASRLSVQFEQLRADFITIDQYKDEILEVRAEIEDEISDTRSFRSEMDPADYEYEIERLTTDLEECRWRLKWVDDQQYKASISRDGFAEKGKWARFEYVDNDGVITNRSITMWERRGAYIVGFDRSRKEERTFRQDRISDWTSG